MTANLAHFLLFSVPLITLAATNMLQTWQITKLGGRIFDLECTVRNMHWLTEIKKCESIDVR